MAGSFTTAFTTSAKAELAQAVHDFTQTTGHDFKCALGGASPVGTYDATTTNYSDLTGNGDEVASGSGYTTGGFDFTAANNVTPQSSGTTAYWQWGINPSWIVSGGSISTSGCVIYNATQSNRAVYVGSFGGAQTVSGPGTLTLVMPTNGATTSLLAIT
jgi:hypothetical protein